ncbi:hypothetical protein C4K02_0460 [Pseudomonas synxantha]|nr:hypothetical protein C4K02_0460 [Pseudomonas synxantha]
MNMATDTPPSGASPLPHLTSIGFKRIAIKKAPTRESRGFLLMC